MAHLFFVQNRLIIGTKWLEVLFFPQGLVFFEIYATTVDIMRSIHMLYKFEDRTLAFPWLEFLFFLQRLVFFGIYATRYQKKYQYAV